MSQGGSSGKGGSDRRGDPVSVEGVRGMADLARIRPREDELESLVRDLNRILLHVAALEEVEGAEEEETDLLADPTTREPDLAPDGLSVPPSDLAPDWRDGFFVLPRLPSVEGGGE